MNTVAYDVAVSAVASDAGLVSDLQTSLALELTIHVPRVELETSADAAAAPFDLESTRLTVILHQRLWQYDLGTRRDAIVLRERLRDHPKSVCVVMLDETPVPRWLSAVPCYDLATLGPSGMTDFILAAAGGADAPPRESPQPIEAEPVARWSQVPIPFLGQPRAYSALRHQLDAITGELQAEIERSRTASPERVFELHVLPHRVIARLDAVGLSVSWINGRQSTVADGRLMVIAWRDVATTTRGVAALKFAAPTRERTYHATGKTADEWCWRADDRTDMPYSSTNLAADWIAQTAISRAD